MRYLSINQVAIRVRAINKSSPGTELAENKKQITETHRRDCANVAYPIMARHDTHEPRPANSRYCHL